jgi:hypothetical protein
VETSVGIYKTCASRWRRACQGLAQRPEGLGLDASGSAIYSKKLAATDDQCGVEAEHSGDGTELVMGGAGASRSGRSGSEKSSMGEKLGHTDRVYVWYHPAPAQ